VSGGAPAGRWVAIMALLLSIANLAVADTATPKRPPGAEPAIPSGRDDFLADMVGRGESLPGSCKFSGGSVEHNSVVATYTCAGGEVTFRFLHPDAAPAAAARSERFAIALESGAPPPGLEAALLERIRARERGFEWVWPGASPTPGPRRLRIVPTVAALLAFAWFIRYLRRRRAAAQR